MDMAAWFESTIWTQNQLANSRWEYWKQHILFSFSWWLLLFYLGIAWFIAYRLVDRDRIPEIGFVGLLCMTICLELDSIGAELSFWDYPTMVIPWGSRLFVADASIPVFMMLLYQYFSRWETYVPALVITAAVFAYILEPLMISVGVYRILNWSLTYSFFGYIGLGLFLKWATEAVFQWSKGWRKQVG